MNTDNQMMLLVDENDNFLGKYAKRITCHTGKGLRHRAFVTVLENDKGQVLLQKRKHALWDGFWDITATTHVLHLEDHDETYAQAGERVLNVELGITGVQLKNVGGFPYFAQLGKMCENEYCAVLLGIYTGKVHPNPEVVYDYKWLDKKKFITSCLKEDPAFTPWAILTGRLLDTHL